MVYKFQVKIFQFDCLSHIVYNLFFNQQTKMKFIKFEYRDLKGKVSNREALVVGEPTDKVSTIDVTGMAAEDVAVFAHQYQVLKENFVAQIEALKGSYDLKHNYRTFFPDKMVVQEEDHL